MKYIKTTIFSLLTLLITFTVTACGNGKPDSTFPNIDDADIPDVLETRVGTECSTYYTTFGATDDKDYKSVLVITYKNTTDDDYTSLLSHYQSDSSGTDENGSLLFDWGRLQVTSENDSITVTAYIK